ncbi:site-specific integrase [Vulcanococcus limneticus]|uniref:site-specific integrase n=1 Tax=Vulcanococcus limneticus TaxID=2170428 RepID=UPI00398BCD18
MPSDLRPPGLIQRYREELQVRHDARRTVKTDEQWLRRFLRFQARRHPREMGRAEVNAFLSHLAVDLKVSVTWTLDRFPGSTSQSRAWISRVSLASGYGGWFQRSLVCATDECPPMVLIVGRSDLGGP